jgi:hypothetical protein
MTYGKLQLTYAPVNCPAAGPQRQQNGRLPGTPALHLHISDKPGYQWKRQGHRSWRLAGPVLTYATVALATYELSGVWRRLPVLQRVLGILVALFIIIWIVANPASAGDTVHAWITGVITFLRHIG